MKIKKELRLRVRYEPPQAILIRLTDPLSFMASFSRGGGGFEDWDLEDGFSELDEDESLGTNDWSGLGLSNNDTH